MNKVQKVNAIDEKFILCGRVFWGFERRGRRRRRGSVQLSEVAEEGGGGDRCSSEVAEEGRRKPKIRALVYQGNGLMVLPVYLFLRIVIDI